MMVSSWPCAHVRFFPQVRIPTRFVIQPVLQSWSGLQAWQWVFCCKHSVWWLEIPDVGSTKFFHYHMCQVQFVYMVHLFNQMSISLSHFFWMLGEDIPSTAWVLWWARRILDDDLMIKSMFLGLHGSLFKTSISDYPSWMSLFHTFFPAKKATPTKSCSLSSVSFCDPWRYLSPLTCFSAFDSTFVWLLRSRYVLLAECCTTL